MHSRPAQAVADPAPTPRTEPDGRPDLSIVVPMYNEEESVDVFFAEIIPVLDRLSVTWEIVCVNDGSRDRTIDLLLAHRARDERIRIVDLARNFGKEAGLTAGLEHASGRAVVPMDADLQDPPQVLEQMLAKWREGYDVVYGVRASRETDGILKRFTAAAFYRLINAVADREIPANTGDFRLMDARVVEALRQLPERNRFMKGLFAWVGFRQTAIEYHRDARRAGTTKWNYWKLWNFALDGITAFSTVPLRVWTYIGALVALASFVYAFYLIGRTLLYGVDVPGYASLMVVILFLNGLQMIMLGIFGEYLGRQYQEVKRRPVYLVNRTHGCRKAEEPPSP